MGDDQALRQWFGTVDADKSGKIDSKELQKALAMGNLNFSIATVSQMIRMHDRDGSSTITFEEFKSLHTFLMNMQNSFLYFDRDRGGSLSPNEVLEALRYAGFTLEQPAFEKMLVAFDPDRSLSLSLAEFIGMTLFLQGCSQTFTAFDKQREGKITLTFNQFVYACSNCR